MSGPLNDSSRFIRRSSSTTTTSEPEEEEKVEETYAKRKRLKPKFLRTRFVFLEPTSTAIGMTDPLDRRDFVSAALAHSDGVRNDLGKGGGPGLGFVNPVLYQGVTDLRLYGLVEFVSYGLTRELNGIKALRKDWDEALDFFRAILSRRIYFRLVSKAGGKDDLPPFVVDTLYVRRVILNHVSPELYFRDVVEKKFRNFDFYLVSRDCVSKMENGRMVFRFDSNTRKKPLVRFRRLCHSLRTVAREEKEVKERAAKICRREGFTFARNLQDVSGIEAFLSGGASANREQ